MLMGRYIFLIYLNGSTRSQAYWGLFKSWLRCLEMNLQSSLVLLFQHPIHHSRQQGHQMLPTCQACQVGFLHTHPGTLPILVVNQAVLNHLVVSILTQQVPSTLPSLLWPLLVTVVTVGHSQWGHCRSLSQFSGQWQAEMVEEGGDGLCPGRAQRLETSRGTPEKGHRELGELATHLDWEVAEVAKNMELLRKKNSVLLWRKWKINLKTMILMKLSFPQPQYTNRSSICTQRSMLLKTLLFTREKLRGGE